MTAERDSGAVSDALRSTSGAPPSGGAPTAAEFAPSPAHHLPSRSNHRFDNPHRSFRIAQAHHSSPSAHRTFRSPSRSPTPFSTRHSRLHTVASPMRDQLACAHHGPPIRPRNARCAW